MYQRGERIEYYINPWKAWAAVVGCCLWTAGALAVTLYNMGLPASPRDPLGWISLAIGVTGFVICLRTARERRPVLIRDDSGITCRLSGEHFIAWEDIDLVRDPVMDERGSVAIIQKPPRYIRESPIRRALRRAGVWPRPFVIRGAWWLDITEADLALAIRTEIPYRLRNKALGPIRSRFPRS